MESSVIVQIAVIGAMGLIGLGVASMIISGIKSLAQGKQDVKRIVIMAVPFIIFGIAYGVLGDIPKAGVLTTMSMMGIMVVSVIFTGLRGTFKF
ncbi:MAG: hypothetical protein NXI08_15800 [bacterium]|nr:hypothetical protein [bacterium]